MFARQIVRLDVDRPLTSRGYGASDVDHAGERSALPDRADAGGPEGLEAFGRNRTVRSLDGLTTGFPEG
ncbi:MAG: hypothetical protein CML46_09580 [Rhodobacteraceae bacterium]|nr:hypothetical protein [Paracoccaceae bacterium]MBR27175.1 hypothetical protein [Paracoccaceae bacterium]